MPNRVIKETIRTSKSVNALSDFEFRVWLYLITYVDDHGRGSADPELLKGLVFPRRKGVTEKQIQTALDSLANTGMVILYEYDGEPFFYFPNWDKHQRIQNKHSKFPDPPKDASSPSSTVNHGESPLESNPIQSESNTKYISTETQSAAVLTLPLVDKTDYGVTQEDIDEWKEAYPAVDVMQELREMKAWCNANEKKRKTRKGIRSFINSWLAREQDKGTSRQYQAPQKPQPSKRMSSKDIPLVIPGIGEGHYD